MRLQGPLPRLKLSQLLLLNALGEARNLRRAARALGLAQPAATRLLQELERMLGVGLFDRSRRGTMPTFLGEAMIRHASVMLADMERARTDIEALSRGASGLLRVGTVVSIAPLLLPRTIAALKLAKPMLSIALVEGTHEYLMDKLGRGELDVILARRTPDGPEPDFSYELLMREGVRIVSGPQHPLAQSRRLSFEQLVDQAWILPPQAIPFRYQLDTLFLERTGRRPANVIESISIATNQTLLREVPVLGFFPAPTAGYLARQRLIRILPVTLHDMRLPVALIWRKRHAGWPALQAFFEIVRETARELERSPRRKPRRAIAFQPDGAGTFPTIRAQPTSVR